MLYTANRLPCRAYVLIEQKGGYYGSERSKS